MKRYTLLVWLLLASACFAQKPNQISFNDWTRLNNQHGYADGTVVTVNFNGMELEYRYDATSAATVNSTVTGPGTIADGDEVADGVDGGNGRWLLQYKGPVNVLWWGTPNDNTGTAETGIEAAMNYVAGSATDTTVFIPTGEYRVTTTIDVPQGVRVEGDGSDEGDSVIRPTISDGTATMKWASGAFRPYLANIKIKGANATVGTPASKTNTIGVEWESLTTRGTIKDVQVQFCQTGFLLHGHIHDVRGAYSNECVIGFDLDGFNACSANLWTEHCEQSVNAVNCTTTHFDALLMEGRDAQSGLVMDGCTGLTINAMHCEWHTGVNNGSLTQAVRIGATTTCKNIVFLGGSIFVEDGVDTAATVLVDRAENIIFDGLSFSAADASSRRPYEFTANSSDVQLRASTAGNSAHKGGFLDTSENFTGKELINLTTDPNFKNGTSSFSAVIPQNAVFSATETTLTRFGGNAIRLTPNRTGSTIERVILDFNAADVARLAGKTITVGAWVYLENYNDPTTTVPLVQIRDETAAVSYNSRSLNFVVDKWAFAVFDAAVDAATTDVSLRINGTQSTNVPPVGASMIVDQIVIAEGNQSVSEMLQLSIKESIDDGDYDGTINDVTDLATLDLPIGTNVYVSGSRGGQFTCVADGTSTASENYFDGPTNDWERRRQVEIHEIILAADLDTTPSVQGVRVLRVQNSAATTITNFDDPADGQRLTVLVQDANTTIADGTNLEMYGVSYTAAAGNASFEYIYDGTIWQLTSREE